MTFDEQRAAEANSRLQRTDVEWAASKTGGIYLRPRHTDDNWREWKPDAGEMQAINAVAARAMASGITGEQWTEMVRRGVISREVAKVMRESGAIAIAAE